MIAKLDAERLLPGDRFVFSRPVVTPRSPRVPAVTLRVDQRERRARIAEVIGHRCLTWPTPF